MHRIVNVPVPWAYSRAERRFAVARTLLALCLLCLVPGCRKPPLQRVEHPETGYQFPAASETASIRVIAFYGEGQFEVPKHCWEGVLGALTPSQIDTRPLPWDVIAFLEIRTKQGAMHYASVYLVDDQPVGAFSAGPSQRTEQCYRGGDSKEFQRCFDSAYKDYLKQKESAKAHGSK